MKEWIKVAHPCYTATFPLVCFLHVHKQLYGEHNVTCSTDYAGGSDSDGHSVEPRYNRRSIRSLVSFARCRELMFTMVNDDSLHTYTCTLQARVASYRGDRKCK